MKTYKFLIQCFIIMLFLNTQLFAAIFSMTVVQQDTIVEGIDLSKKKYFESIFNKDERKQLKKANSYLESAKKYMLDYENDRKEIEMLYTIAEATSSPKSRDKALLKARKLEEKSLKKGTKALDNYKDANEIRMKIYTSALNRCRLNDGTIFSELGKEVELISKENFEKAKSLENNAPKHDEQLKFNVLNDANNLTISALCFQENAFALYQNDSEVNLDDFSTYKKVDEPETETKKGNSKIGVKDSVIFPLNVQQYNPIADANLYRSKADLILKKLKLSEQEVKLISEANRKVQYANDLMKQVDEAYVIVDSLNLTADRTEDFNTRDKIRNAAIEKEQNAFYKLTNATNIYLDVNETRYKIYKAHYPKLDEKVASPDISKAKALEKNAEEYYDKAKNEILSANKQTYRSEQYIQLMGANDMLLYAIQLQESAYGIYLNIPQALTEKTDSAYVTKNKKNAGNIPVDKEKLVKTNTVIIASTFTYSKDMPKAVPYKTKKGVVFMVQLGVFKGIVPAEKFGTVQPVIFDEFQESPNRRYMVGEYRSAEGAELALEQVKKAGYIDAFIVSMIDGERKSYSAGKEKINPGDEHYNFQKRTELARVSGEKNYPEQNLTNTKSKTGTIDGMDIRQVQGLVYLVQLGMYQNPRTYAELNNLQPIYTDKIAGKGTRYMMGTYTTITKAREENKRAINAGMKDSYVIAYYNGENISLEKAQKLESAQIQNQLSKQDLSKSSITFMVQVGAYSQKLEMDEENKLKAVYAPRNLESRFSENMNVYLLGNYKTYKEADFLKKKLVSEGHQGVFVVAFNGDKKIPVADAIKLNNNK